MSYSSYQSNSAAFNSVFGSAIADCLSSLQVASTDVTVTGVSSATSLTQKTTTANIPTSPSASAGKATGSKMMGSETTASISSLWTWTFLGDKRSPESPSSLVVRIGDSGAGGDDDDDGDGDDDASAGISVDYDVDLTGISSNGDDDLFATVSDNLADAVTSGAFTSSFDSAATAAGASSFAGASSNSVAVALPPTSAPTTSSSMDSLQLGGMAAFIVFMIVLTFFVPYLAHVYAKHRRDRKEKPIFQNISNEWKWRGDVPHSSSTAGAVGAAPPFPSISGGTSHPKSYGTAV